MLSPEASAHAYVQFTLVSAVYTSVRIRGARALSLGVCMQGALFLGESGQVCVLKVGLVVVLVRAGARG